MRKIFSQYNKTARIRIDREMESSKMVGRRVLWEYIRPNKQCRGTFHQLLHGYIYCYKVWLKYVHPITQRYVYFLIQFINQSKNILGVFLVVGGAVSAAVLLLLGECLLAGLGCGRYGGKTINNERQNPGRGDTSSDTRSNIVREEIEYLSARDIGLLNVDWLWN